MTYEMTQAEIECLRAIRIAAGEYCDELNAIHSNMWSSVHNAYWWLLDGERR